MSISTPLGSVPVPQAGADMRTLALAAGQTVEAKVLGPGPGGATQVAIGRQVLTLQLPTPQPAGAALTLSVQQSEGQIRLEIVAVRPPATGPVMTPAMPTAATNVQLSAAALSSQATVSAPPATASIASGIAATGLQTLINPSSAGQATGGVQPPGPAQTPVVLSTPAAAVTQPAASPGAASAAGASGSQPAQPANSPTAATAQVGNAISSAVPGAAVAPLTPAGAARPSVPYQAAPVAAAAQGQPAFGVTAGTSGQTQPVQQLSPSTPVGQHAPAPGGPASLPPGVAPSVPSNPQAALHQMVHSAVLRQDSVLGLTAAITAIAGKVPLPEPVAKVMQQVLAQRVLLDAGLNGGTLKQAVRMSGIFQEAMLAAGQAKTAAGDIKTSLLGLQRQLLSWLGTQAPIEQVASVAPPVRGQVPRAKTNAAAPRAMPLDPQEAGKVLLERTEAALSRLRLHQHASLPEPAGRHEGAQWSLDLPVIVGGQQALLQIQIHQDAEQENQRPEDRGWQVRFAINLDQAGEVGAQISLRGKATGVLLWAEKQEVADLLSSQLDELREHLSDIGLAPGAVIVRAGSPAPQAPPASASGQFLDETR